MTRFVIGLVGVACVASTQIAGALALGERDVAASKTVTPPVIDGRLDEAVWDQAVELDAFVGNRHPTPARAATAVRLLYDDENLYVGFRCTEPNIAALLRQPSHEERDSEVWMDDCVEVFIDANHDHATLVQFITNFRGVMFDGLTDASARIAGGDWDGIWSVGTFVGTDHWTAEFAIPFCTLGLGGAGAIDAIGMNFTREKHTVPQEYTCWACTHGGFHKPEMFGHLRELDIRSAGVVLHGVDPGSPLVGQNTLSFRLGDSAGNGWSGTVILDVKTAENETLASFSAAADVPAAGEAELAIDYEWSRPGSYVAVLSVRNRGSDAPCALQSAMLVFPEIWRRRPANLLLYRNETGYLRVELHARTADACRVVTELHAADGRVVGTRETVLDSSAAQIPVVTQGLPPGKYALTARAFVGGTIAVTDVTRVVIIDRL